MARKLVCCASLVFFLWFNISCLVYENKLITPEDIKSKNDKILTVIKKTGERLEFVGELPGTIQNGQVVGGYCPADKIVNVAKIKHKQYDPQNQVVLYATKDGKTTSIERPLQIGRIIFQSPLVFRNIPLSEIKNLWVERNNQAKSILTTLLLISILVIPPILILKILFTFDPYEGLEFPGFQWNPKIN